MKTKKELKDLIRPQWLKQFDSAVAKAKMEMQDHSAPLVGERLNRMRQHAGLALGEVSDISDGKISRSTLSAIEHGKAKINIDDFMFLTTLYENSPVQ